MQLTGGEPLIHPRLLNIVQMAKKYFHDVGVTTNGTFLSRHIDGLLQAEISRIHISLQLETLTKDGADEWITPMWLASISDKCERSKTQLRVNLPVARENICSARNYLLDKSTYSMSANVFALLPEDQGIHEKGHAEYLAELKRMVSDVGSHRETVEAKPITIRSYLEPTGHRCVECTARSTCTEASRSLRIGVDGVIRPCLASREWDMEMQRGTLDDRNMRNMTLLALDYSRPSRNYSDF